MPDTKSGREKKGLNKRAQRRAHLMDRELTALEADEDLPEFGAADGEFLAAELPDDR